ncbi:flagellar basal body rod protein FlgC [Dongia soli]|jgi:flagellar basal-body rod protein FlgC|uniref:Flagellar basal-body rod protein FlgC n=1 Tax=Dongia soli TaxID=600628 RepID=A0ABU5E8M1_9PROT|nr:flagellar basal body rod protein FlgC [Dongia soli]MDY0882673.1 flagellar basal body rod protein FlgC [Dongia soli]
MDLNDSLMIAAAGMRVQGERLRVISENLANADSVSETPGGDPYRRKTISFKNALNKELGLETVQVSKIGKDQSDFRKKYDPGNPAADKSGYVTLPNVNTLIELTDMREAERSYEANLKTIEASRTMLQRTIDILR